jgi:hypothetical protein
MRANVGRGNETDNSEPPAPIKYLYEVRVGPQAD